MTLVLLCFLVSGLVAVKSTAQPGCSSGACISVGPRLASISTAEAELLNPLLQALLPGTTLSLNAVDWSAIASSDLSLDEFVSELQGELALSEPEEVFNANVSLGQLQLALIDVLQADGQTTAANALGRLPLNAAGLTGTVAVGELLNVSLPHGTLSDIELDLLDLVTGFIQLYNYQNVASTPSPVTLDTAALGLPGLAGVEMWAQVVEPPVYVCGLSGSQFYTASIRMKTEVELLGDFDFDPLLDAVGLLSLGVANVTLDHNTAIKFQLYSAVARAEGTITGINAIAETIDLTVEPGLAELYIGEIADSTFFHRSQTLSAALFSPLEITEINLQFETSVLFVGTVDVSVPLSIFLDAAAEGDPGSQSITLGAPFPDITTVSSGAVSAGTLLTDLLNDFNITIAAGTTTATVLSIPVSLSVLNDIINDLVTPIVDEIETTLQLTTANFLQPFLNSVLGNVIDPMLDLLGIQIGQAVISADGIATGCAALLELNKTLSPGSDPGLFDLSINLNSSTLASIAGVGNGGSTPSVVTVPGQTYNLREFGSGTTDLSYYLSDWECRDQDSVLLDNGTGAVFNFTAPTLAESPVTITCTLTNTRRQANLSVTKSDGIGTYSPGSNTTYVINVSNAGPHEASSVTIADNLPDGVTLSAPWSCLVTAGSGSCSAVSGGTAGDRLVSLTVNLDVGATTEVSVPVSFSAVATDY